MLDIITKPDPSLLNHNGILSVILKPQIAMNRNSSFESHMQPERRTFEVQQKDSGIFSYASLIAPIEIDEVASWSVYKLCCFSWGVKQAIDDLTDVHISIKIFNPSISSQDLIEVRNTF